MAEEQTVAAGGGPTPAVRSCEVLAGGLRLHYLETGGPGSVPPLVLLHGTAIDSAALSFGPSMPELAKQRRVIALDWPGYGSSERPQVDMTMPELVELLGGFLASLGLERVHLAGFSMGGAVGLGFALAAPRRLASLTIIGSYGLDDSMPVPLVPYVALRVPNLSASVVWGMRRSRLLVRLVLRHIVFSDTSLVTEKLVEAVHTQLQAPQAERSFVAWLRGELRPFRLGTTYADSLAEVDVPTLLLHGANDRVVPARKATRASTRIPGSRLVLVPGCGHWVMREAPGVFTAELASFTTGLP